MVAKIDTAKITLWGHDVGAVTWVEDRNYALFEFNPDFLDKGLDISPLQMGIKEARNGNTFYSFPALNKQTYLGLPGMLADSLPDKFGNSIINNWLARNGRDISSFSPIERLCYIGERGMGALQFYPAYDHNLDRSVPIEIKELVALAQNVMAQRSALNVQTDTSNTIKTDAIMDILRVGTSAGGARPKAIIAMNSEGHILSGQTTAPNGYDYWILKFDGVTDLELGEPKGYGRIEYAYYLMAKAAGITMMESRLLEEGNRAHFLTKRFDRLNNEKLHVHSLCGIAHYDFNMPGAYSYEQTFSVMRQLHLDKAAIAEQYRRMVFNVIARNQDDHTKNIAFIMDAKGQWHLTPAYDVIYSHNPHGIWTNQHQMSINGKRDHFSLNDLVLTGESAGIPKPLEIIHEVMDAVGKWSEFSHKAGVSDNNSAEIVQYHRLKLTDQ